MVWGGENSNGKLYLYSMSGRTAKPLVLLELQASAAGAMADTRCGSPDQTGGRWLAGGKFYLLRPVNGQCLCFCRDSVFCPPDFSRGSDPDHLSYHSDSFFRMCAGIQVDCKVGGT